jgi:hypothetical protein
MKGCSIMTAERKRLSNRRSAETRNIEHVGLRFTFTVGRDADGTPLEVFVANHKAGNASDIAARDAGILVSLLLQYGCNIRTIGQALSRNSDGSASSIIGAVLDQIIEQEP